MDGHEPNAAIREPEEVVEDDDDRHESTPPEDTLGDPYIAPDLQ